MAIVIILIGTILLVGVLMGGLALTLSFEEEADVREKEAAPLHPDVCESAAPEQEVVAENDVVIEPMIYPQPAVPAAIAMEAGETLKSV